MSADVPAPNRRMLFEVYSGNNSTCAEKLYQLEVDARCSEVRDELNSEGQQKPIEESVGCACLIAARVSASKVEQYISNHKHSLPLMHRLMCLGRVLVVQTNVSPLSDLGRRVTDSESQSDSDRQRHTHSHRVLSDPDAQIASAALQRVHDLSASWSEEQYAQAVRLAAARNLNIIHMGSSTDTQFVFSVKAILSGSRAGSSASSTSSSSPQTSPKPLPVFCLL